MSQLTKHTAFITGSTLGIGREMAIGLCEAGASVVLHGLDNDEQAQQAVADCGGDSKLIIGDLASDLPACAVKIAEQALQVATEIDLLVCNAGTYIDQPFLQMDFPTFDRTMKLNVY